MGGLRKTGARGPAGGGDDPPSDQSSGKTSEAAAQHPRKRIAQAGNARPQARGRKTAADTEVTGCGRGEITAGTSRHECWSREYEPVEVPFGIQGASRDTTLEAAAEGFEEVIATAIIFFLVRLLGRFGAGLFLFAALSALHGIHKAFAKAFCKRQGFASAIVYKMKGAFFFQRLIGIAQTVPLLLPVRRIEAACCGYRCALWRRTEWKSGSGKYR